VREFVDINGKSYFIDTFGYQRDESNAQCQSMNMSMVAFDDAQEWNDVESWLITNGKITKKTLAYQQFLCAQTWPILGSGHLDCGMKTRPLGTGSRPLQKLANSTGDPDSRP